MEVREENSKEVGQSYILPFVQGCQSQRLCLVCSFGSRWLWTTEPGSVWKILVDIPERLQEEGRPGRDRCCGGRGVAYLWKDGEKDGKVRGQSNHSDTKLHTPGTSFIRVLYCNISAETRLVLCFLKRKSSVVSHGRARYSLRNPAN